MNENQNRINRVIDFINSNYADDINLKNLSKIACYSESHFQRVFSQYIGETPFNFIKKIRLENSVIKLIDSNKSITEIALEANYSSSANYSKAFKIYYNVTPKYCREIGIQDSLETDRIEIDSTNCNLKIKIEEFSDMTVAYVKTKGNLNMKISIAWGQIYSWVRCKGLYNKNTTAIGIVLKKSAKSTEGSSIYLSCLSVPDNITESKNIKIKKISGGLFGTINFAGKYSEIDNAFKEFYNNWLPNSPFKALNKEVLQIYPLKKNLLNQNNSSIKICFPIAYKF